MTRVALAKQNKYIYIKTQTHMLQYHTCETTVCRAGV